MRRKREPAWFLSPRSCFFDFAPLLCCLYLNAPCQSKALALYENTTRILEEHLATLGDSQENEAERLAAQKLLEKYRLRIRDLQRKIRGILDSSKVRTAWMAARI